MHGTTGTRRGLLALGAIAACSLGAPALAQADTFNVQAGAGIEGNPAADLQAFYPGTTMVHVGDQITFTFGGFHTVAFLPGDHTRKDIEPPPLIQPNGGTNPPTDDAAGDPFWWGDSTPSLGFNPELAAPSASTTVDGDTLVSSGIPQSPTFTVTMAKAGMFSYVCGVHPHMRGLVKVLPAKKPVPDAAAQTAKGQAQLARDQADATALDEHLDTRPETSRQVFVSRGNRRFTLLEFYPQEVHVHAGQTVHFRWFAPNEVHTVTFGSEDLIASLRASLFAGPSVDPVGAFASEPPGSGVPTLTPDLHGNGFLNSGILPNETNGQQTTFTVKFTVPGTYNFACLIHETMNGEVVVS